VTKSAAAKSRDIYLKFNPYLANVENMVWS